MFNERSREEDGDLGLSSAAGYFEPFASDAALIRPFEAREGARRYKFKALTMRQAGGLASGPSALGVSSLFISFATKKKEISADEEFSFEMAVQQDAEKRPYIYFNDDLSLMLVQDQHAFSADIFARDKGA